MDGPGFDAFARAIAVGASRRHALRLLAAAALAGLAPRRGGAAPARQDFGCAPGLAYCEEQPGWAAAGCYDLSSDYLHCGSCSYQCPSAGPVEMACIGGACVVIGCSDLTDCSGNLDCVDLSWDANNCGACGNVCASGVCEAGNCASGGCGEGLTYCTSGDYCADLASDPYNCGECGAICDSGVCEGWACVPAGCGAELTYCPARSDGQPAGCFDLSSEYFRCGSCDFSCPTAGFAGICSGGQCVPIGCEGGLAYCPAGAGGQPPGCYDLFSDNFHCGECHIQCPTTVACIAGECVSPLCEEGLARCAAGCVDLGSDPNNCGVCDTVCPSGVCEAGSCATGCEGILAFCPARSDGQPAGCFDLSSDYARCGSCDRSCPSASPGPMACIAGECQPLCEPGLTFCASSEHLGPAGCYDLASNRERCGSCDRRCPGPGPGAETIACIDGTCVQTACDPGFANCTGGLICTDLASDPDHCGECGNACDDGVCEAGACVQRAAQTAVDDTDADATTTPQAGRPAGAAGTDATAGSEGGARGNRRGRAPRTEDAARNSERQGAAPADAGASTTSDAVVDWPFDPAAGQWTIVTGYRAEGDGGEGAATAPGDGRDYGRFALEFALCPEENVDAEERACALGAPGNESDWEREATQGSAVRSPVDGTVAWTEGAPPCLTVAIDVAGHPGYRLALFNVDGRLERGQRVTRGKRIGKVAKRGCDRGDRIRMALYKPRPGADDDPAEEREGLPFASEWVIAGCSYPDDGQTNEQYRGELVPCDPGDDAARSPQGRSMARAWNGKVSNRQ